jgi:peptide deformylase
MAAKDVLRWGDPLLFRPADPVTEFGTPELEALILDMQDTMAERSGAGIAAPQIGVSQQVVIFGGVKSQRYPDADDVPFTILINPLIEPLSSEMENGWEGCLSVPGMRGLVARHARIRYRGFDQHGNPIDREAAGFHARVVQHECDHLNGILYPMRIPDLRNFGFAAVLFPGELGDDD